MALWTKSEILEALKDEILEQNLPDNLAIDEVLINGRQESRNGLFVALSGENHDAHDFLDQALANGCTTFLIHKKNSLTKAPNANFILVKDTFKALYKLAEFSRQRSHAKIIGLTGSVGKTSTKEMLKLIFQSQGKTFATHGNLNNHIGVPLSLCNFSADCEFGIFEMGMNHAGEIEPLSKLVKPHLALITNVGPVHIEFFENEEGIAKAKSEILLGLESDGIALINADNKYFDFLKNRAEEIIKPENIISFGQKNSANYQIVNSQASSPSLSVVEIKLKNGNIIYYEIASSNPITIFNSAVAIACLDLFGKDLNSGISTLKHLQTFSGRGNIKDITIDNKVITLIDDSYNASVLSMKSGIEYAINLKNILGKKRVVIALGDMLELGSKSQQLHKEVIDFLIEKNPDFIILVGKEFDLASDKLDKKIYKKFSDSQETAKELSSILNDGDILYIKGSRGIKMEKILDIK